MKLTKAQRQALINARDFGNAWNFADASNKAGYVSHPWRVSMDRMHNKMFEAGLLDRNHKITEAGIAALS